jgi:hypothetical protein
VEEALALFDALYTPFELGPRALRVLHAGRLALAATDWDGRVTGAPVLPNAASLRALVSARHWRLPELERARARELAARRWSVFQFGSVATLSEADAEAEGGESAEADVVARAVSLPDAWTSLGPSDPVDSAAAAVTGSEVVRVVQHAAMGAGVVAETLALCAGVARAAAKVARLADVDLVWGLGRFVADVRARCDALAGYLQWAQSRQMQAATPALESPPGAWVAGVLTGSGGSPTAGVRAPFAPSQVWNDGGLPSGPVGGGWAAAFDRSLLTYDHTAGGWTAVPLGRSA